MSLKEHFSILDMFSPISDTVICQNCQKYF